ncbi:MAG TPA: B12-binding domain-containing radical SAM protein [Bryobacteraceae bacterium]|nr:B12-binding domain-containing radical SAM protein [Bryobacteraceae bacterium]
MQSHPLGSGARILFSSVFGPYAQNDEFGSRSINPMELYHNQVTRAQDEFSIRMFHRSWGIMMIQQNLANPSTLLDFPTRERFAEELRSAHYDIVGISSIIVNVGKVREMCRMVREISPTSTIVVGGHVAAIPGVEKMIDADHIVKGEGIAWMREFLSQDVEAPIVHPDIVSGFGHRIMGMPIPEKFHRPAATLIPSVGCPMGCNFCTTSSFFGGKGKIHNFFETGDELYELMCGQEERLKAHSFFIMDENFLLQRKRALRLLELMQGGKKSWDLYVFSSANAIRKYSMEELVQLGVSWLWMGLESPQSQYSKLNGTDTIELTRELREHGIKLLGSTIIGLEHHTPGNINEEIDYAISHDTDFHQFMLYTPVPGTPLYQQVKDEGRLIDVDLADIHGQDHFNFQHAAISREASKRYLDLAFWRDFERNGPSLFRICRTTFEGWKRYRNYPDLRVRERFARELAGLRHAYTGILWAMERRLRDTNEAVSRRVRELRKDILRESGLDARLSAAVVGPLMLWAARRERKRLESGNTYEPEMIVERRNWAAAAG